MSATQSSPEPAASGAPVSLAALAGFQRQLSRKLAENPLDLATAWRLAEIGRAAGDLDAAIRAYRACLMLEPGNPAARQLLATLEGQMLPRDEADAGDRPVPFLMFENVMPAARLDELWRIIRARRENLQPSLISRAGERDLLAPSYRHSLAMPARKDAGPLILSAIAEIVDPRNVAHWFRTRPFCLDDDRTEVEIAAHGNSDFFRIHRDTGPLHADRVVTFVFYLFREPRCFSGGDLLLHDWSAEGLPRAQRFTRLHPANNRLVIFPSECWHQVLPVSCHTGDPLDARLTVHGWFHAV